MKQYPSSEDILTINVLQKELTIPSLSPIYREELERIQKELPNFEYIPTLSREDKSGFAKGYVHDHYLPLIDSSKDKPWVYFCGWDRMISEGRFHLDERGFQMTKDIRVEIFG